MLYTGRYLSQELNEYNETFNRPTNMVALYLTTYLTTGITMTSIATIEGVYYSEYDKILHSNNFQFSFKFDLLRIRKMTRT